MSFSNMLNVISQYLVLKAKNNSRIVIFIQFSLPNHSMLKEISINYFPFVKPPPLLVVYWATAYVWLWPKKKVDVCIYDDSSKW